RSGCALLGKKQKHCSGLCLMRPLRSSRAALTRKTRLQPKAPHNDSPISEPSEDRFGIEPFAKTLATGILQMNAPEGTVIALNGPWGSGKSSTVNLVRHHL